MVGLVSGNLETKFNYEFRANRIGPGCRRSGSAGFLSSKSVV